MGLSTVSVVIPAFDEEAGIGGLLDRVLSVHSRLAEGGVEGLEVIVVDDGSRDRTAEIVRRFPEVCLICHGANRGYGAALKTGFARATGDLVAFFDADGTYPPESLPELCQAALAGGDIVIGSRMAGTPNEMPAVRRVGNVIFAGLVTLLGDQRVHDCASGMRVVRREILPLLHPLPDGLHFTPVMTVRAVHEGLKLVEVAIPYGARRGRSKLSVISDGLRYARSIVWTVLAYNPVRVLGFLGFAGIGLAAVIGLGLAVLRLRGVAHLGPLGVAAAFAALVAGVAGASLFTYGVTFNYLVTLFRGQRVRVGVLGRPLFDPPLERYFGRLGLALAAAGVGLAAVALGLGIRGWDVPRLWLYLVASALLILVGLQLVVSWALTRTLDDLAARELRRRSGPVTRDVSDRNEPA